MFIISPILRRAFALAMLVAVSWLVLPAMGGGGVTGTGYRAFGRVTDFGSIFVNAIEFFTTGANISINGAANRPESELKLGMVLRVTGTVNPDGITGQAQLVEYNADHIGSVDAPAVLGTTSATFTIFGQSVVTDDDTVFVNVLGASGLQAGDVVEVSGYRDDAANAVRASRIERRNGVLQGVQLSGRANDVHSSRFNLGSLTVTFPAPVAGLVEGSLVRVTAATPPSAGVLSATTVTLVEAPLAGAAGSPGSQEGVIAGLVGDRFTLNGQAIVTTPTTTYKNGTVADLANGQVVEAEGTVATDGSLVAAFISFRAPDAATVEANVVAKGTNTLTLLSTNGITVLVDASTDIRDKSAKRARSFAFADLRTGDHVQVRGAVVDRRVIDASRIERLDASNAVMLKTRARGVADPRLSMLGLTVAANSNAAFQDANGKPINGAAFFAQAPGERIKASGYFDGTALRANELEIEP